MGQHKRFNIFDAIKLNYQIITVSPNILAKMKNFNRSLNKYSIETVKQFYKDANSSGLIFVNLTFLEIQINTNCYMNE